LNKLELHENGNIGKYGEIIFELTHTNNK